MVAEPRLRGAQLSKWFGGIHALRAVDFSVGAREIVGLLGGNGAGKSTLVKILSGVCTPDAGHVLVDGRPVSMVNGSSARAVGIETVHQQGTMVEDLSVWENLFLGRELSNRFGTLNRKAMKTECASLLRSLGVEMPSLDAELRLCSGGQRQAVALSRALRFGSSVLIFDEPMTALSARGRARILDTIARVRDEKNAAVVLVSHDIARIFDLCDRFVVLRRGEIKAELRRTEVTVSELEALTWH